jgi:V8-like Glu-specific endopeptidase
MKNPTCYSLCFGLLITLLSMTSCHQEGEETGKSSESPELKVSSLVVGGSDQREAIKNFNPSIVSLMNEHGSTVCTGTVIGARHVLTAAHCFYNNEKDSFKRDIQVVPAFNHALGEKPLQRFFIDNIYISKEYISKSNAQSSHSTEAAVNDFAIIEIKETTGNTPFAQQTVIVEIDEFDPINHLDRNLVSLKGYHDDLLRSTPYQEYNCKFGYIFRSGIVGHTCDTNPGASGSSLQFNQTVVAVHTGSSSDTYNLAAPLTFEVLEDINAIIDERDQSMFRKVSYNQKPFIGLDVMNNCNEDIFVAFYFKDLDQKWIFKGHYPLSPGDLFVSPVTATSTNIYYHAQTQDRSITFEGAHPFRSETGQSFNMKELKAESRFYDHRLNLTCD